MTKRIFSNKALAIVLVLAVLMSCVVFSFGGASAAEETLLWENDFTASEGTDTNWMKAYTNSADNAWFSNGGGNFATYDSENSVMALKFTNANSWMYMSGFAMMHKNETHANTGEYGYHGGETDGSVMAKYGAFRPAKGTYKVTFKYKVESFSSTAGAVADICVGFALRAKWKWYGSTSSRANFINSTNNGNYEIAATVDASTANTWQTATVTIDQPLDDTTAMMHVFARNNDNAGKDLNGTTILVDEIKVYEVIPASTKLMWQNTFDKSKGSVGTVGKQNDGNWLGAYSANSGESDGNWISQENECGIDATYDETNEAMKIRFVGDNSWTAMGGFVLFHEAATVAGDGYGNVGVGQTESSTMTNFGVFRPGQGSYIVSLDYKVTEFSDVEGAAADICFGFARRGSWAWQSVTQTRDHFINNASGVIAELATVTASDKGDDWRTVSITIDQPYNDTTKGMLPNVFVRTSHNVTQKSLAGTEILIDNVKVYSTKAALDQTTNDRSAYLYNGETEQGATNLHRYVVNGNAQPKDGVYTSMRLAAKYTAGDNTGSTIIIGGTEYQLAERGILVGKANRTLNIDNYLWKSGKQSGFDDFWTSSDPEAVDEPVELTYTLRLANMGEAWFTSTNQYQFRSYYKVLVPYVDVDGSEKTETFTIYGGVSDAFTFGSLADTFEKSYWFSDLES